MVCCSTAASSLSRWGRLPVRSSCSMTATTISSLMPCVSILKPVASLGEGGGVVSAMRPPAGAAAFLRLIGMALEAAGDDFGLEGDELERLHFFGGRLVVGGGRRRHCGGCGGR